MMSSWQQCCCHPLGNSTHKAVIQEGSTGMSIFSMHRRHALALIGATLFVGAMPMLPARADDTVTLWSWRTEDDAAMHRIFAVFEKENPGVKVDIQFTPDADYQNRLSTALRGGRGPDIAQLKAYGELQPFVEAGYLDALDQSVPELKNFPEAALGGARGRADNKLYGVPYSVPMMGVFYNEDIF